MENENSKRKTASRENGKLGGPKTEAGRRRSSQNSLKHGLFARRPPVLTTEELTQYEILADAMVFHHQPKGSEETDIVSQLIDLKWRYYRKAGIEDLMIEGAMDALSLPLAQAFPDGVTNELRQAVAIADVIQRKEHTYLHLDRILDKFQRNQWRLLMLLKELQGPRFNAAANNPQPVRDEPEEEDELQNSENEPTSSVESMPPTGKVSNWQPLFEPIRGLKLPEFFGSGEYHSQIHRQAA